MPLPTKEILSTQIQGLIASQKAKKSTEDPEKAFADGLADIILETIKAGTVTGSSATGGPVTGSIV